MFFSAKIQARFHEMLKVGRWGRDDHHEAAELGVPVEVLQKWKGGNCPTHVVLLLERLCGGRAPSTPGTYDDLHQFLKINSPAIQTAEHWRRLLKNLAAFAKSRGRDRIASALDATAAEIPTEGGG